MDALVEMIIGSVTDPVRMAFVFMIFLAVLDALFSFIGTLFIGVMSK